MTDGDLVADSLALADAELPPDPCAAPGSKLPLDRGHQTWIDVAHGR
jgi:hypothetical protein